MHCLQVEHKRPNAKWWRLLALLSTNSLHLQQTDCCVHKPLPTTCHGKVEFRHLSSAILTTDVGTTVLTDWDCHEPLPLSGKNYPSPAHRSAFEIYSTQSSEAWHDKNVYTERMKPQGNGSENVRRPRWRRRRATVETENPQALSKSCFCCRSSSTISEYLGSICNCWRRM